MSQPKPARKKGGYGQNDRPVTTLDQSQGQQESKENTENINIDMTIGELLSVTKCESFTKKFEIFQLAGDITQYTKPEFKEFLTEHCGMNKYSAQFIQLGKAYDELNIQKITKQQQQSQSNGM